MRLLLESAAALLLAVVPAAAQDSDRRMSPAEAKQAIEALLADPAAPLTDDPSCKSDLSDPAPMSIAQGLAIPLIDAAVEGGPVTVVAACSVRPGYPLASGEERCRIGFSGEGAEGPSETGLAFVMNWTTGEVRPGSVECY
jgi:hypothetical protein